ncbi:MAG: hypothetical protein E3J22_04200 [Candidatus Aminicenantes bacterium]|jgi:hypothetical protein|nr:MAG: hypothetical protein E3J22_04200 [Candidatus Aminicenantes bacterium]
MRIFALIVALAGLILTIVPALFVFLGDLSWEVHARWMFIGMILWFVFAPIAMKKKQKKGRIG